MPNWHRLARCRIFESNNVAVVKDFSFTELPSGLGLCWMQVLNRLNRPGLCQSRWMLSSPSWPTIRRRGFVIGRTFGSGSSACDRHLVRFIGLAQHTQGTRCHDCQNIGREKSDQITVNVATMPKAFCAPRESQHTRRAIFWMADVGSMSSHSCNIPWRPTCLPVSMGPLK